MCNENKVFTGSYDELTYQRSNLSTQLPGGGPCFITTSWLLRMVGKGYGYEYWSKADGCVDACHSLLLEKSQALPWFCDF